jgi:hypothetical protein
MFPDFKGHINAKKPFTPGALLADTILSGFPFSFTLDFNAVESSF